MITGFEIFEGPVTRNNADPMITIRKGGLLVLNAGTLAMLPEGTTHVQLGYSADHQAVAIVPAKPKTKGSYTLRESRHGTPSRLVQGSLFFEHYSIATEKVQRFAAEDFGNGAVGFHMNEAKASPKPSEPAESAPVSKTTRKRRKPAPAKAA